MFHLKLSLCHSPPSSVLRACLSQVQQLRSAHTLPIKCCHNPRQSHLEFSESRLHTTAGLHASEKEQRRIQTMWGRFATKVRMFAAGVRALYGDLKLANEYRAKYGKLVIRKRAPTVTDGTRTDVLYSRKELQFVHTTLQDVKQMLPTVILFFIPFIGYIAPFLAFAYPEKLLTRHFWPPSLRDELEASAREAQRASFVALAEELRGVSGGNVELGFLPEVVAQFTGGEQTPATESHLHQLSNLPADHLGRLFGSWGVKPLLPTQRGQLKLLQRHLEYIFVCDWLVHLEGGVSNLAHPELVSACMERCLHFDLKAGEEESTEEMRRKLDAWVGVVIQHQECPSVLMAHLPLAQYWTPETDHQHI